MLAHGLQRLGKRSQLVIPPQWFDRIEVAVGDVLRQHPKALQWVGNQACHAAVQYQQTEQAGGDGDITEHVVQRISAGIDFHSGGETDHTQ